jgi:hypothetical protein
MHQLWGGSLSRSTRDIDFMGRISLSVEQAVDVFRDCIAVKVDDDGLRFEASSIRGEEIRSDANYHGVRVTFRAYLENAEIRLQIDVGFGDVITPGAQKVIYPSLLGLEEPRLLGYTPETTVAEKLQAMVVLDMANSRMKDFYDLLLLATGHEFTGQVLTEAIRSTFSRRRTAVPEAIPIALTPAFSDAPHKQAQWHAYLRKARIKGEQRSLRQTADIIVSFLMPVIESARQGLSFKRKWPPGGPWRDTG